jgi:DNA-binding response OmpR family regulator
MSKKILIIEDEPDISKWFKMQLDLKEGFDVDLASSGNKGLEMISKNQYDLILLDLVMPDIDGIEVMTEIKNNPLKYKNGPIMILTNVTSEARKKELEELGALKFIIKTDVDIEEVVEEFFKDTI